ncbi:MAG: AbrB/MazE/SpoVT family DNA-binding domain-containing protein [Acidimicrobiales bacterium]
MKDTGVARKVDNLGRIVLPAELRRLHGIEAGDELAIAVDGGAIILRKLENACVFCGSGDDLSTYRSKPICTSCRAELAPALDTTGAESDQPAGSEPVGGGIVISPPVSDALPRPPAGRRPRRPVSWRRRVRR